MRSVWAHSIATAVIAEAAGALYDSPSAYTAGLTHDLGRLALFLSVGPQYAEELSVEFADIEEANELEEQLFGMTHNEAGVFAANKWGFPKNLQICMSDHHKTITSRAKSPVNLVQMACQLSDWLGFPEVNRGELVERPAVPGHLKLCASLDPDRLRDQISKRIAAFQS
jgi:HD-like signal output (HDOD) protein